MKAKILKATACVVTSLTLTGVAGSAAYGAQGETWPERPVRVIVPFLAGGSIDVVARTLAKELSVRYGQQFIVDNRAGAGGTIGADQVAKSSPDGYTFLLTAQGPLVINPFIMPSLPYDAQNAFDPVSLIVYAPNVLVGSPKSGLDSFDAFMSRAKSSSNPLTYGTQGVGTTGHITGALLEQVLDISLTHVPYNGFPPVLTDVMSDRVNLLIADTVNVGERVKTSNLHPIAVAAQKRSSVLPEVPTFAELGHPDVVSGPWFSILAPAGTPSAIRDNLAAAIKQLLDVPEVEERFQSMGLDKVGSTPDELKAYIAEEYDRWGGVIKKAGIEVKAK